MKIKSKQVHHLLDILECLAFDMNAEKGADVLSMIDNLKADLFSMPKKKKKENKPLATAAPYNKMGRRDCGIIK